jgi:photosystem II stability/assembly factor-like uncharacterized protein
MLFLYRKKFRIILPISVVLLLLGYVSAQQWQFIGPPPEKVQCTALAIDPDNPAILYLGMQYQGLYRSADRGESWNLLGLTEVIIRDIAICPDAPEKIYAVVGGNTPEDGVYYSANSGTNWERIYQKDPNDPYSNAAMSILMLSSNADTILIGTNDGTFKTTDGGENWISCGTGFEGHDYYVMSLASPSFGSNVVFAGTGESLYRSDDKGESWTRVGEFLHLSIPSSPYPGYVQDIAIDPAHPDTILVATHHSGVQRTRNAGLSWELLGHDGIQCHAIEFSPDDPGTVYVGNYSGLFKSTNQGDSWTKVHEYGSKTIAISPLDPETIYCGARYGGFFRGDSGGTTWLGLNDGIRAGYITGLLVPSYPSDVLFAASNGKIAYSPDNGATWEERNPDFDMSYGLQDGYPDTLGSLFTISNPLYRSENLGLDWTQIITDLPYMGITTLLVSPKSREELFIGSTVGFEGDTAGIFKSVDGGYTWSALTNGLPDNPMIHSITFHPDNPDRLHIGTVRYGIYSSDDYGGTWEYSGIGIPTEATYIRQIQYKDHSPDVMLAATSRGVFLSVDGATWSLLGLDTLNCWSLVSIEDTLFVGTYAGVYVGVYPEYNWKEFSNGLLHLQTNVLEWDQTNRTLFAGTLRGGIYKYDFTLTSIHGGSSAKIDPGAYHLHPAYPNPFNPVTTIRYELPHASVVSLIVYDLLGREVARLLDGYMEPGYHEVQWDGRDFASGIYITRLATPGYSKSIKMVLLK